MRCNNVPPEIMRENRTVFRDETCARQYRHKGPCASKDREWSASDHDSTPRNRPARQNSPAQPSRPASPDAMPWRKPPAEPAESPKKYCPVCRDDDFYCSCPVPGKSSEPRCFTCDLRLSECECGVPEPYSDRPGELAPLQQIYQIAERALAEPPESGSDTGTLIAICTLIEVPPGTPAEPVRERAVWEWFDGVTWREAIMSSPQPRSMEDLRHGEQSEHRRNIRIEKSLNGGRTWQDADTSAAEGKAK